MMYASSQPRLLLMQNSIPTNIEQPSALGWDLIAWFSWEWAFLGFGIATAIVVIGVAYYIERRDNETERNRIEREVKDWVNAIIGNLDADAHRSIDSHQANAPVTMVRINAKVAARRHEPPSRRKRYRRLFSGRFAS